MCRGGNDQNISALKFTKGFLRVTQVSVGGKKKNNNVNIEMSKTGLRKGICDETASS